MVNVVNNINPAQKKDNTVRNSTIATFAGIPVGYFAGAKMKKLFKDGEFTDEFVKEFGNVIIDNESKSPDNTYERKIAKDGFALGKNPKIEKIKEYFKKYGEFFEKEELVPKDLLKKSDKEIISAFKNLFDPIHKRVEQLIGLLKPAFKEHNTFNYKSDSKSGAEVLASGTEKLLRQKAGIIWGVSTGIALGALTFILSKAASNKNQNL